MKTGGGKSDLAPVSKEGDMKQYKNSVRELRRKVFVEIARVAFESEHFTSDLEEIPYKLTPTEKPQYRESIYRERAIAVERVRLAMGMSVSRQDRPVHLTLGFSRSNITEQYYEPPLMQVIPSACDKCEDNVYEVSNQCRKCLSRYCVHACPVGAVKIGEDGHAEIDKKKCIRCGRCKESCPYGSIVHKVRPCSEACGVHAIGSDSLGRAKIDPEICVGCGQCMVQCPFGAIADKSQIFQLIRSIQAGDEIVAEVAPSIIGQFGEKVTLSHMRAALETLGFKEVYEVACGADCGAAEEAKAYAEEVATGKLPFLLTSCCPSWIMLAETQFPEMKDVVSSALTPMTATARAIKEKRPSSRVVFIGPCAAKKLEAMRESVRPYVDFVITFEELAAIFEARGIDPSACGAKEGTEEATAAGRGFGASGGVADAVATCVKAYYPDVSIKMDNAEGLSSCVRLLTQAKLGLKNGYLLEGMGCVGGCVGGAGVNIPVEKGAREVKKFASSTEKKIPDA